MFVPRRNKYEPFSDFIYGKSDIQESASVLSVAMLDARLHVAVLLGKDENERREIKKMFIGLFTQLPGIVFIAKEKQRIVGVMRMKSCEGFKPVWLKMYAFMKNLVLKLFRYLTYLVSKIDTC